MQASESLRDTELLEAVRGVVQTPSFAEGAQRADRENREPLENVRALGELDLNRRFLAPIKGGDGISATTLARLCEEITAVDASTGTLWCMQAIACSYFSLFPPFPRLMDVIADMIETGAMLCGGFSTPLDELDIRKAGFSCREDGDDYVISGKAGFVTGSEGAKYYFCVARRESVDEGPSAVFAIGDMDAPGLEVMGNWDAMGLRGTASHDVVLDGYRVRKADVFEIPSSSYNELVKLLPAEYGYLRKLPFAGLMGCMVGACQALFNALVEHLQRRFGRTVLDINVQVSQSNQAWAQHRLGVLDQALSATRASVAAFAALVDGPAQEDQVVEHALARALLQAKGCLEEFVIGGTHLGGAHGYVNRSPVNRLFRDLLGFNAMVWRWDELAIITGQSILGEPITVPGIGGT